MGGRPEIRMGLSAEGEVNFVAKEIGFGSAVATRALPPLPCAEWKCRAEAGRPGRAAIGEFVPKPDRVSPCAAASFCCLRVIMPGCYTESLSVFVRRDLLF